MNLSDELDALSKAHGSAALARAFGQLQGAVKRSRKEAKDKLGVLAQTFREAMRIWDAQKVEGVLLAERFHGLEQTLRAAWPQTREWKYLCGNCRDYGLVMHECPGDSMCGRHKPHLSHEFGQPCWCSLGARYRPKPKPDREDFTQAGRSRPTRVGR